MDRQEMSRRALLKHGGAALTGLALLNNIWDEKGQVGLKANSNAQWWQALKGDANGTVFTKAARNFFTEKFFRTDQDLELGRHFFLYCLHGGWASRRRAIGSLDPLSSTLK